MSGLSVTPLAIPDVKIIAPTKHGDERGFFSETYNKATLADVGINVGFVQDNHAWSARAGTLRGLHYQSEPHAQDKLVRVVRGRIWDVAVDIRRSSATFGQWVAAEISAVTWNQILVPVGFAHGLVTLEDDTEVIYKVSAAYAPANDHAIAWNDPELAIDWPTPGGDFILSAKDRSAPNLADAKGLFA